MRPGRGVEPPAADRAGQHDRRPQVEQRVAGAPAGDVQAVDPVVEDVDRDGDQEHPDAPLHEPQRPPVDAVAGVAVEDDQADDHRGAGGVEQVRRREVVAQPAEVPGDVPGRAEHLEQEGAEPGGVDPAQLGLASWRGPGAPASCRPARTSGPSATGWSDRGAQGARAPAGPPRAGGAGAAGVGTGTSSTRWTAPTLAADGRRFRPSDWRRHGDRGSGRAGGASGADGAYCRATWQRAQGTWSGSTAR